MIILSHSGKQHSYHVAKALYKLGALERFYTSSYITSGGIQNLLEKSGDNYWSRRYIPGLPGTLVNANWRFEIPEMLLRKIQGKSPAVQKAVYRRDIKFDQYVASRIGRHKMRFNIEKSVFWGFQGSSHDSLIAANNAGMKTVCELATAHVVAAKRILGEEAKLHPEWADSIDNLVFPTDYERRLVEEPHLAQTVIAASSFSRDSLLKSGIAADKISLLPLGFDPSAICYTENLNDKFSLRPLKLLYAGTVTQRKGIKYLLEAMRILKPGKDIELHIIGGIQGSGEQLKEYNGLFTYHSPVSQSELFSKFREYDALVLPTIFEGFGLVIVEAMAAGLPVITTPNSMGPEVISPDNNGYIVPIRDINALANAIQLLREKSDEEFLEMRRSARSAALNFSWDQYSINLKNLIAAKFD